MSESSSSVQRRFAGIARSYGEQPFVQIQAAHVCVIGLGGVGSWVVEALARSGVGAITMIDLDVVAESNINRQLVATTDSLGRDKTAVMKERIAAINPQCQVSLVDDFLTVDNIQTYISSKFDFVIDCIDDYRVKAALIAFCKRQKISILTTGGAGGQTDPSQVRQTDLSGTQHDALLAKTRKLLRQDYQFARNPKRSFSVPCVYSDEQAVYLDHEGVVSKQRTHQTEQAASALSCAGSMGSITHVTGTFAFFAAAYVLNSLAKKEQS